MSELAGYQPERVTNEDSAAGWVILALTNAFNEQVNYQNVSQDLNKNNLDMGGYQVDVPTPPKLGTDYGSL